MEIENLILAIASGIASGLTVSLGGHYFASKREQNARKARLSGWLEWLRDLLGNVAKAEPTKKEKLIEGKLPWWADHMLQASGDAVNFLTKEEIDDLKKLLSKAWLDDIWTSKGVGYVTLDDKKLEELKRMAEKLIAQLSPKDPS